VLSVYNTNQRFMLYPMPFGKDKPDVDFTAPMSVALDTIHVVQVATQKDSTGKYPKRLVTQRQCGKLPKDSLTGKVALLYMSAGCDVSTQVYNAQKLGAIVVIVIHTTDNRDSVELPKQSNTVRYADDSKVRIPCFTVRKGIGEKLTTLLPSVVGIQRPKATVVVQTSVVSNNPPIATLQTKRNSLTAAEQQVQEGVLLNNPTSFGKQSFSVSPNPTRNQANVAYQFLHTTDVTIEVKTASGQLIFSKILRGVSVGTLEIPTVDYPDGTYFVTLQYEKAVQTKKLIVRH
jgi:hypothetical protein